MAYAVPQLSPGQVQQYQTQRSGARRSLLGGRAQNQYQRELAGLQNTQNQRKLNADFDQQRVDLPTNYIQRGVFRSGIYGDALQRYGQNRQNAFKDLSLGYQGQVGNLQLEGRQLEDEYAQTLATIAANEYAQRSQLASQLRSVM